MDHNKHEGEEACSHNTASDEALHRIELSIQQLHEEFQLVSWWNLRKRAYISGMIIAFGMAIGLIDSLARKYDNTRGTLN